MHSLCYVSVCFAQMEIQSQIHFNFYLVACCRHGVVCISSDVFVLFVLYNNLLCCVRKSHFSKSETDMSYMSE
jgi:hypothetical protein